MSVYKDFELVGSEESGWAAFSACPAKNLKPYNEYIAMCVYLTLALFRSYLMDNLEEAVENEIH